MKKLLILEKCTSDLESVDNKTRKVLYHSNKCILADALDDYQNNFNEKLVIKSSDGNVFKPKDGFVIEARWR